VGIIVNRTRFVPAAIAVAALLALDGCGGHATPKGAALNLGASSYDLGTIAPGRQATGTIAVHNRGNETLVVREVRSSDPQLAASLSAAKVPPGKDAQLGLIFRSNGWDLDGTSTDYVLLYTNDRTRPVVAVPVARTIKAPVAWDPRVPQLSPLDAATLRPARLAEVRARGPIAVQSFLPFVDARAVPLGPNDYRIDLVPQDGIQIGLLLGMVKVLTGDVRMPEIDLPVRTQVLGNLDAVPYRFDFGIVRRGKPAQTRVDLVWKPGHRIRIREVLTRLPGKPYVQITHRGRIFRFRLGFAHVPATWSLAGSVDVYTDDPLQPVYRIPVVGWGTGGKAATRAAIRRSDPDYYKLLQAVLFADDDIILPEQVASDTLAGDRSPQAVSMLLRLAGDDNWLVRQRAFKVLGVLKATPAVEPARRAMIGDPVFEVRRTAVATLGQIEGRKALPDLLLGLQDDDAFVRSDTCDTLRELTDPSSIPALRTALQDPEDIVKDACKQALQAMHVAVPAGTP
jgi:hypothetical protein